MCLSLLYIHFYEEQIQRAAGVTPPYPKPDFRKDLFLILGELHEQVEPVPAARPKWLNVPERGLYTGIAVLGAIGSGKTRGLSLPAMRQLFGYEAQDSAKKLSGIVLEVKGDLCRHLRRILKEFRREEDYIDVSLDSDIRYNPLNNNLDPYAQAFNIASIITSIWGKGKEPFWQQSYTDLVRYVIVLHRIQSAYVTLVHIFRTVISSGQLEKLLGETSLRFSGSAYLAVSQEDFAAYSKQLMQFGFSRDGTSDRYIAEHSQQLEAFLEEDTHISAMVYSPKRLSDDQQRSHSGNESSEGSVSQLGNFVWGAASLRPASSHRVVEQDWSATSKGSLWLGTHAMILTCSFLNCTWHSCIFTTASLTQYGRRVQWQPKSSTTVRSSFVGIISGSCCTNSSHSPSAMTLSPSCCSRARKFADSRTGHSFRLNSPTGLTALDTLRFGASTT